jgi:hypothetical protein
VLVITILAMLVGAALALYALLAFERHSVRRYGYMFFTKGAFTAAAIATGCIVCGHNWWLSSQVDGDPLNGLVLVVIGSVFALTLVVRNLRRTGVVVGTCGSVLQAAVFGVMGWVGLMALAVGFLLLLLALGSAKPVWVVNRW